MSVLIENSKKLLITVDRSRIIATARTMNNTVERK